MPSSSRVFSRPCPKNGNYDVFLSFRGKDTRHGFTANLYYALMDNEVYTFMDIKLVGKVIDDLFEIIGRSKMAVVVYSKSFASSYWCLKELETIMQRMNSKEKKMLVIPIFYNVDVHELKHLAGKTGEFLNQHIQNYGETTVQKWKDAITSLGHVSGIPYRDRYERDFIKEVIDIVKDMLEEWEETQERSSKPYSSGPATEQDKVEDENKESTINQQAHVSSAKEENTQALALQTDTKAEKELVLTLDHSNFSETISKHDFIVVEFYAPWCEHSKKLAPEYEKAASILSSNHPRVILAKVDANEDVNKELTSEQDINGFPTLKIFRDGGKVVHLYNGPLEAKGIVEYLKKQSGPASAEIRSAEDACGLIGDKSLVIVGVFTKFSGEEYDNFMTLAEKLRSDYEFAHTRDAKFLPRGDSSVSGPLVRLFKPFDELFVDSKDFNVEALEKFVEESTLPVLTLSGFPTEIIGTNKSESTSGQVRLKRSKTEKHIPNILAEDAARIFDDNVPVQQKLKLLNRIATVKDDGTVEFEVPGDIEPQQFGVKGGDICSQTVDDEPLDATDFQYIVPLQIVMLIVGTRGDVQPFVAIGKRLQEYGHRVRLATHSNFKEFVLTAGLEFFPLGGDPKVIAGYMLKNKGFLPSGSSEIQIQRNQTKEIIYSLLPACKDPDIDSGIAFKANAIIANPPAYGHTHVAEALKIPLHVFSTMPWTPTSEFPHPLSRVQQQSGYKMSYQIVDSMIWLGIRDIINDLRKKKLKLRPVTYLRGSGGSDSDVPHGYIWSPHLVPKPRDWGQKVDVVGFCFLDLASNYEPPEDLVKWLQAGEKPIYIGFGSMPVQEPKKMTQIIVEALEKTGQRGIINKGWGGFGELAEPKDSIYLLDNVPHDWLFLQCKAVVHHGGAGTTAAGLKAACPTTIVPFFGDQLFWGEKVHARGVGPPPIPIDEFSLPELVHSINYMLDPVVKELAVELAKAMEKEDGVTAAVKAFFKQLSCINPEPETVRPTSSFLSSIGRSFGIS